MGGWGWDEEWSEAYARDRKRLSKRFPSVDEDIDGLKAWLLEEGKACARTPPRQQPLEAYRGYAWVARWPNSSKGGGKSGGLRLVYLALGSMLMPVRLFDKSEMAKLEPKDAARAILGLLEHIEESGGPNSALAAEARTEIKGKSGRTGS